MTPASHPIGSSELASIGSALCDHLPEMHLGIVVMAAAGPVMITPEQRRSMFAARPLPDMATALALVEGKGSKLVALTLYTGRNGPEDEAPGAVAAELRRESGLPVVLVYEDGTYRVR
ncbi:MAG: hypothetical protein V1735_05865 [Nanoarchaeota archaeon]